VKLKVDGRIAAVGKAPGSIPLLPGRKEASLPFVHVGVGHARGTPIGDCDYGMAFRGTLRSAMIHAIQLAVRNICG